MKRLTFLLLVLCLSITSGTALADKKSKQSGHGYDRQSSYEFHGRDDDYDDYSDRKWKKQRKGLNRKAAHELEDAGVNKYLNMFTPISSTDVGDGWTKYTFDPEFGPSGPAGPVCIAGTDYSVFTRKGKKNKLLIFEQGGGACWQGFYQCNIFAEDQEPPAPPVGIWDFDSKDNPFADYSIVYMPYCDGSVFAGDNDVPDAVFPLGFRFHRGLRNQSAGMDLARKMFPHARRITVAGSSAGGVGAAGFAPFLVRFLYGNQVKLTVFNDAGPVTTNPDADAGPGIGQPGNGVPDVMDRASDWQFGQFYPASCTECNALGQGTAIIKWRLDNDSTIREAFYETDADGTNRFFLDLIFNPAGFRNLIVTEHGLLNAAHPDRYKRFIVAGDDSHTALQTPLFYSQDANGVLLNEWTRNFIKGKKKKWADIVEDAVPSNMQ